MGARQEERMARTLVSLEGLSVGDGFGERFFVHPDIVHMLIDERAAGIAVALHRRYTDGALYRAGAQWPGSDRSGPVGAELCTTL